MKNTFLKNFLLFMLMMIPFSAFAQQVSYPDKTPAGEVGGGIFYKYFLNIFWYCGENEVIVGFEWYPENKKNPNNGKRKCVNINTLDAQAAFLTGWLKGEDGRVPMWSSGGTLFTGSIIRQQFAIPRNKNSIVIGNDIGADYQNTVQTDAQLSVGDTRAWYPWGMLVTTGSGWNAFIDFGENDGSPSVDPTRPNSHLKANIYWNWWGDFLEINGFTNSKNTVLNNQSGNVGIGTANPQAKLDVNGEVFARNGHGNIAYFGGDNNANDIEAGSSTSWVNKFTLWNKADSKFMNFYAAWAEFNGKVKIADGTQGEGKVLLSDVSGYGKWSDTWPYPCKPKGLLGSNLCYWNGALQWWQSQWDYQMAFGLNSLATNTTWGNNMAFGDSALWKNKTWNFNSAFGSETLRDNISWNSNVAVGDQSMMKNTTGNGNTAVGNISLINNTTGNNNVAIGIGSMMSNIDGYNNSVLGFNALWGNKSADGNVAIGTDALRNTWDSSKYWSWAPDYAGNSNTAIGDSAMFANTYGWSNVAVGAGAMRSNVAGNDNTAVGINTMKLLEDGKYNATLGSYSLEQLKKGNFNTAINFSAMRLTEGLANVSIGSWAMWQMVKGSYNTAIGNGALSTAISSVATTAIGDNAWNYWPGWFRNTYIGSWAGSRKTPGDYNVIIWSFAGSNTDYIGYDSTKDTSTIGDHTITYISNDSISISPSIDTNKYPVGSFIRVINKWNWLTIRVDVFEVVSSTILKWRDLYAAWLLDGQYIVEKGANNSTTSTANIYPTYVATFQSENPKRYDQYGTEITRFLTIYPALPAEQVGKLTSLEIIGETTKMGIPRGEYFKILDTTHLEFISNTSNEPDIFRGTSGDIKKDTTFTTISLRAFPINQPAKMNEQIIIGNQAGYQPGGSQSILIGAGANAPDPNEDRQLSIGNFIFGRQMNTILARIGIGEWNPQNALHVTRYWFDPVKNSSGALSVQGNWWGGIIFRENANRAAIGSPAGNSLRFWVGWTDNGFLNGQDGSMTLDSRWFLGIGNPNPSQKLDVVGTIRMQDGQQWAGKIIVGTNMGDLRWTDATCSNWYALQWFDINGNKICADMSSLIGVYRFPNWIRDSLSSNTSITLSFHYIHAVGNYVFTTNESNYSGGDWIANWRFSNQNDPNADYCTRMGPGGLSLQGNWFGSIVVDGIQTSHIDQVCRSVFTKRWVVDLEANGWIPKDKCEHSGGCTNEVQGDGPWPDTPVGPGASKIRRWEKTFYACDIRTNKYAAWPRIWQQCDF